MKRTRRTLRRGTAVVELAVILPVVVLGVLGMSEIANAFMVRQTVAVASREAARAAARPVAKLSHVQAAADRPMQDKGLTGYTVTCDLEDLAPTDKVVTATVTLPFDRAAHTGNWLGGGFFEISMTTKMRREGLGF